MSVAALALICGLIAFVRLWSTGDRGWGKATAGIILGLICVSPAIYAGVQFVRYPQVIDVSTDWENPPELLGASADRPDPETEAAVRAAFPNAVNRSYQLDPATLFSLAEQLVLERGWDIRVRRAPGELGRLGQINSTAMTMIGWRDEIALNLNATPAGTRVSMRSRSLDGIVDLGENGRRIEAFLLDLDTKVSEWIRDNPVISE